MRLIGQIITPGITQDTAPPLTPGHLGLDPTTSLTAAATLAFRGNFLLNSSKTTANSATVVKGKFEFQVESTAKKTFTSQRFSQS